jgi:two-component system NtrC family sensor kinase
MPDSLKPSSGERPEINRRILVIDDNPAIHEDFRKILEPSSPGSAALEHSAGALFGEPNEIATEPLPAFKVDFASQGAEGAALVGRGRAQNQPYALAFVDMRMPPGWDGIETATRIWELDAAVQIVICTAYSDHRWQDIFARLSHSDRLLILKKPFDNIEVLQLASALTERWRLTEAANRRIRDLQALLERRTAELAAANARASAAVQDQSLQPEH